MKKIMIVFGTRPEAVKMCPVIKELKKKKNMQIVICVTGQHEEMVVPIFNTFNIVPDYNFHIMKENQSLFDISCNILTKTKDLLAKENPDLVIVHGDTSSAYNVALSCFYMNIPVAHVEAGLRTNNIYSPYPEEFNRKSISLISKYDFAPTETAKENLLKEGKNPDNIWVTGNTVIDSLKYTVKENFENSELAWAKNEGDDVKLIFLTAHRRENIGKPMENMFIAIRNVLLERKDIKILYPVHKNPKVRETAQKYFADLDNIHLIEPLDVVDCHNIMARSYCILTDSGGVQEEAAALHIPTIVMRDFTERTEGLDSGILKLVGTETKNVYNAINELLDNKELYNKMKNAINPFGDGNASEKIADILEKVL